MKMYTQSRKCGSCQNEERREVSEHDAAFEETRQWKTPCKACGNMNFVSETCPIPEINEALLEEWIHNKNLFILDQDEEIIIASSQNLPLLEKFLLRRDALLDKRRTLLAAICVIVYEGLDEENFNGSARPFVYPASVFLKQNAALFDEVGEHYISDYIKKLVYPVIGRLIQ